MHDRHLVVHVNAYAAGRYAEAQRMELEGSTRGPAVFFRLRELHPGDEIAVTRANGSRVRFVVERTEQYDKTRFPTDEVYYPTLTRPCGGQFDATTGHYRSNIIFLATIKT